MLKGFFPAQPLRPAPRPISTQPQYPGASQPSGSAASPALCFCSLFVCLHLPVSSPSTGIPDESRLHANKFWIGSRTRRQ